MTIVIHHIEMMTTIIEMMVKPVVMSWAIGGGAND